MGKFSFLRKSSDKDKTESPNPYAQQHDPPSYDGNQHHAQSSQPYSSAPAGSRVGLPSSVRPGGLPNKPSDGVGRSPGFTGDKTSPPPAYNSDSHRLPGSSSQHAAANLPSNSTGRPMGSGYPSDKLGASGGFGSDRYGTPAFNPSSQASQRPTQNQGGYGGLENDKGGLFANYNAPPKYPAGPDSLQPGASGNAQGTPANWDQMTEEERENFQTQAIIDEANRIRKETVGSGGRSRGLMDQALAVQGQNLQMLYDQGKQLERANDNLMNAGMNCLEL